MFSSKELKLPVVFDLETGEVFEGMTVFDVSEKQGKDVARSDERDDAKYYFQSKNSKIGLYK